MKMTINNPELDFVCSRSSMGRERYVAISKDVIAKNGWMEAVADTATRDIKRRYLATLNGKYAIVRQYADLFPYENAAITTFEKDEESQVIEKQTRSFNEIRYGDHLFELVVPVMVEAELHTEGWMIYHEDLNILTAAPTVEECIDDFQEYFYALWKEYANQKDDELTDSGQILKHKLLDIIKK